LKRFSVSVEADPAGEILEECAVELREQWRIHGVRCAGGYAAAVAINSLEVEPVVWGNGSLGLV
jgi:hypothetical protein